MLHLFDHLPIRRLAAAAVLVCGWLVACSSSPEQPDDQQPETAPSSAEQIYEQTDPDSPAGSDSPLQRHSGGADVDGEQLEQFADAVRRLQQREQNLKDRGESLEQRTAEAESPAEVQRAQQDYLAEMEDAVEEAGLTMPEFMELGKQIRDDPELRQQVEEHIDAEKLHEFFGN